MQKRLAEQLDTVHSVIGSTLATCKVETKSSKLKASLKTATSEIREAVTALASSSKSRSLIKTRKSLVAIENTLDSLHAGLDSRELKVKEFRAACSNLETKFVPNFVQNLIAEVSQLPPDFESKSTAPSQAQQPITDVDVGATEAKPQVDARVKAVIAGSGRSLAEQMADIKKMLDAAPKVTHIDPEEEEPEVDPDETEEEKEERLELEREADRLRREGVTDASSINTLEALRKKRSGLPARLTKLQPFIIAKLPLVPVFPDAQFVIEGKGSKFERTLNQLSLKYAVIQGYVFLEEQLILCVSRSDIEKANIRHKDSVKETAKEKVKGEKRAQKSTNSRVEKAQEELDEYMDRMAKLVARKPVVESTNKPHEKKQREIINEIRGISKAEYNRVLAKEISRRAKYMELTEADAKRRGTINLSTGHARLKTDEAKAMKLSSGEVEEHFTKGVQSILTKRAKAEVEKLPKKDRLRLKKLLVELDTVRDLAKPYIIFLKKIADLKEQIENASKAVRQLEDRMVDKEEDIKAIRKAAKPKLNDITPSEYAMNVLVHINEVSHASYQLVVQDFKVNVRNSDILCFWIMPAAKLNVFSRLGSANSKIQWAFPWSD